MDFNPKEIQKFYDTWAPMLQALPAVIEAAERGEELKRGITTLERQLQGIQQQIAETEAKVDPVRKSVDAKISELRNMQAEAESGYKQYIIDAKAHIAEINKETDAEVARIKGKIGEANAELRNVERELAMSKAKADAEFKQHKQAIESEMADLEAKKQAIEDALASLKAKIG